MSTGDQADFLGRLRDLLPYGWFPNGVGGGQELINPATGEPLINPATGEPITTTDSSEPILDGMLMATANIDAFVYGLIEYAGLQTRIKTATDGWLDLIAYDFFGLRVQRAPSQADSAFATTIVTEIFRIRNTRAAIIKVIQDLTAQTPLVRGPWRDGAFIGSTLYCGAGLCGSRNIPYQSFVIAYRGNGVADSQIYAAVESVRSEGTILWVQIQNP